MQFLSKSKQRKIFVDTAKFIFKFIWKGTSPKIAKTISKKNKVRRITLPDIKTYCIATVIEAVWCWKGGRQRSIEQNRGPRSRSTHMAQQLFGKSVKTIQWRKDSIFNR